MPLPSLLEELAWRGLLFQKTDALADAVAAGPFRAYAGFDPTAPSLHVGSLVPVMGLVHLQRAGNVPVALVGGGTGMIGDPSGKAGERQLISLDVVQENAESIGRQLARFLDFSGSNAAIMDNNARWLLELRAVDFMRDVGKHFTLNYMLAKESVSSRLESGISYTEFSYMLLQAYDFLELYRRQGVTVQIGGSDQWGNITTGIELIRRVEGGSAHGFTMPLVTTSSGAKFGKTEAGSVWLDADRTSPYRFYQFWINVEDADAGRFLRYFTLLDRATIDDLERAVRERPDAREAQARLALEVTSTVHGEAAAATAAEISRLLFGGADPRTLGASSLVALRSEVPSVDLAPADSFPAGAGSAGDDDAVGELLHLLVTGRMATSRGAARRLLEQGGVYINGARASADTKHVRRQDLLPGNHVLLRKGAREYLLIHFANVV
jgi:tyrosyl-tRNA synthetase